MEFASITSTLAPLALLACPVGMGVMMLFMMRKKKHEPAQPSTAAQPSSVEVMREERRRLDVEISRLGSDDDAAVRAAGER